VTMLITLDQAKAHLRIDSDDGDEELEEKIEEASAAVISYLKSAAEDFLDTSGEPRQSGGKPVVPWQVRAATLQLLTALYENRGEDGGAMSKFEQGYLPPSVTALLYPLRDPSLA